MIVLLEKFLQDWFPLVQCARCVRPRNRRCDPGAAAGGAPRRPQRAPAAGRVRVQLRTAGAAQRSVLRAN